MDFYRIWEAFTVTRFLFALAALVAVPAAVQAQTTRHVCTNGTAGVGDNTYTPAQLQTAINDSTGSGDILLLEHGLTFTGSYTLPRHGNVAYATIQTGTSASCVATSAASFPAANVRMTPALAASNNLATIRCNTNNCYALRTADPSGGNSPNYWRIKYLQFGSNTSTDYTGSGTMLALGSDDNALVTSRALIAANFEVIQNYFKGDPITGQYRGLACHFNTGSVQDNTFEHFKTFGADGQAIWCNSQDTTVTFTNNKLSGGTIPFQTGGASGAARQSTTLVSAASTTQAVFTSVSGLRVGMSGSIDVAGLPEHFTVTSCGTSTHWALCDSTTVNFTAVSATPGVPGGARWGLVPSITFTKNHVEQPLALRSTILGVPQSMATTELASGASGCASGTLVAGNYSYRVVARLKVAGNSVDNYATSGASAEVTQTTGATGCVRITWAAVANAGEYRVYGRQANGQTMYWTVAAGTITYTDTGSAGTTGSVPAGTGSVWRVKNLFELKNCRLCVVNGNVFENIWNISGVGQGAYAILFTVANTGGTNDSTVLREIDFTNNKVCHAAGGMQLSARHATATAGNGESVGRTEDINVSNNLWCDINGAAYGASSSRVLIITTKNDPVYVAGQALGVKDLTYEHNTIDNANNALLWNNLGGYTPATRANTENFIYRNNLARKGSYGIFGSGGCTQGSDCWTDYISGTSVYNQNVIADATCGAYPSGTLCPTSAVLNGEFTDQATGNYILRDASPYKNAGTDNTDIGAIIPTITALTDIALSGDNRGVVAIVVPPSIATTSLPGGQVGATYASVTLSVVCNAEPCTVAWTGNPAGLSLGASTRAITQTGTLVAGTYTATVTVTDAGGRTGARDFSFTIADITVPTDPGGGENPTVPTDTTRPDFDYQRCGSVSGIDFPTEIRPGKALVICDQFFKIDTGVWYTVTTTSPSIVWSAMGSGTSVVTFLADSTSVTWTDQPVADTQLFDSSSSRLRYDATNYRSLALGMRVQGASASTNTPQCYIKYSTDDTTYTTLTGSEISLATTGTKMSTWVTLPTAAQANNYWRVYCSGGDGTVGGGGNPAMAIIAFYFRQF